jgi:hypothetical protein
MVEPLQSRLVVSPPHILSSCRFGLRPVTSQKHGVGTNGQALVLSRFRSKAFWLRAMPQISTGLSA